MAIVTKEHAIKIADKLEAVIEKRSKKAHDLALIYHEGRLVAQFGIRRGSKKELGHDHIPNSLHIRPRQARLLGECPLSREDWLEIMSEQGLL